MLNSGPPTTYTYNAGNELVTSQTSAGVTTSTYDGSGNLLTSVAPGNQWTTNTWDGENRLTRVALPSGIVDSFTYNGDGQRVQKQDSTGTTNHVWDGQNILLETNASNIIQVVYTLEPVLYGNLISQSRGGVDSFYLFDGLGSTRNLANISGAITDSYVYDSWGTIVSGNGSTTNAFKYVGKHGYYYDTDLQQLYLRLRYYRPAVGRFVSIDPSISAASIWNSPLLIVMRYVYSYNNAANAIDPSGLDVALVGSDECKAKLKGYFADACKDFFADPKFTKDTDLWNCMSNLCDGLKPVRVFCPGETSDKLPNACKKGISILTNQYICGRTLNGNHTGDGRPIMVFCPDLNGPDSGPCGWKCTVFHEMTHACQKAQPEREARACTAALYPNEPCTTKLPGRKPDPCDCEGYNCKGC